MSNCASHCLKLDLKLSFFILAVSDHLGVLPMQITFQGSTLSLVDSVTHLDYLLFDMVFAMMKTLL